MSMTTVAAAEIGAAEVAADVPLGRGRGRARPPAQGGPGRADGAGPPGPDVEPDHLLQPRRAGLPGRGAGPRDRRDPPGPGPPPASPTTGRARARSTASVLVRKVDARRPARLRAGDAPGRRHGRSSTCRSPSASLLIGDLPTNLWWACPTPPPLAGPILDDLAEHAEQVIYDSLGWPDPHRGVAATSTWLDRFERGAEPGPMAGRLRPELAAAQVLAAAALAGARPRPRPRASWRDLRGPDRARPARRHPGLAARRLAGLAARLEDPGDEAQARTSRSPSSCSARTARSGSGSTGWPRGRARSAGSASPARSTASSGALDITVEDGAPALGHARGDRRLAADPDAARRSRRPSWSAASSPTASPTPSSARRWPRPGVLRPGRPPLSPSPARLRRGIREGPDPMSREHDRLREPHEEHLGWRRWGPYVSERAWATVREDYSRRRRRLGLPPPRPGPEQGLPLGRGRDRRRSATATSSSSSPPPSGTAPTRSSRSGSSASRRTRGTTARTSRSTTSTSTPPRPTPT